MSTRATLGGVVLVIMACLVAAGVAVGVVLLYRSPVPVASVGQAGAWDETAVQGPSVIWNADLELYQMWYDGRGDGQREVAIGHATSTDGETWTKYEGNPVIPPDARWPCVLHDPADPEAPYRIWYNVGRGVEIASASSSDGINWTESRTVIERGPAGSHDDANVAAPSVVKANGEYWMYYDAGTSTIESPSQWGHYIALATSPDGVNWTKRGTVLKRGAPDQWDGVRVLNTTVVHSDGLFEMWYVGGAAADSPLGSRNIGHATSTDGLTWTKSPDNPVVLGSQMAEEYDYSVSSPAVIKVEDGYKVWFTAIPSTGRVSDLQIGYAEYPPDAWSSR